MDAPLLSPRASSPAPFPPTVRQMKPERNAGLIMGTNNNSVVSKRSVERLYLPEPHFYRYFVRKPQRRAPTINRGYWLRMRAIENVVKAFLERPSEQQKIVLNLGCGFDPLPFRWLAREPQLCQHTRFVDVDYKELMLSKAQIIMATLKMRSLLTVQPLPHDDYTTLAAQQYLGVGCDLRDLVGLYAVLSKFVHHLDDCLVLCVAEVSLTYMDPNAADALIAWAARLSSDVTFCLLEQYTPDGADHPFADTMLKHFDKLRTPLRSVHEYPSLDSQQQRFFSLGYSKATAKNLWSLWGEAGFLSPSQRLALDKVESFDEWEEFAVFAAHYFLVTAHVGQAALVRSRRDSIASSASDVSARTASPRRGENQHFGLTYVENIPTGRGRAHHGAAFAISGGVAIAHHGGIGPQTRLTSTDVYGPPSYEIPASRMPSASIPARSCHTITTLHNRDIVLVGGRASPAAAMSDCWIHRGEGWDRIQDLPTPRYRHTAAPVILPGNLLGLIVFGGKDGPINVLTGSLLWDTHNGWRKLQSLAGDPMPRFGANMLSLGPSHGFLFGGMRQDGVICHGFWRWRLCITDELVTGITFESATGDLDASIGAYPYLGRFGATASIIGGSILIIGGISQPGCIARKYETLSITGDFLNSKSSGKCTELSLMAVEPDRHRDWPRPFLVGHSSVTTIRGNVLVVGGGATCFSFGTFWNDGTWLVHDNTTRPATAWGILNQDAPRVPPPSPQANELTDEGANVLPQIEHVEVRTAEEFAAVVVKAVPRIIDNVDIGPCRPLWTIPYLRSKIGEDREVVVHSAPNQRMNFHTKNFKYFTQTFGEFLDQANDGNHLYLRSLSADMPSQKPAKLEDDFPEIATDFRLPLELHLAIDTFHSSALRISSYLNMWLHYDTMANLLCQVNGSRRLVIFPPKDITRLDMPPGMTTSRLELFDEEDRLKHISGTSPIEVILNPGDLLFIPPLWPHTGSSKGGVSIAVNIFFRNLARNGYAPGKDVYGNRDLQAYEDGRRDLQRIVRRFDHDIPPVIARAYLMRLADELKARAS